MALCSDLSIINSIIIIYFKYISFISAWEVTVSFFVNNIKKIDVIEGTVEIDFQRTSRGSILRWLASPSLTGHRTSAGDRDRNDETPCCWNPQIEVNNNVSPRRVGGLSPAISRGR